MSHISDCFQPIPSISPSQLLNASDLTLYNLYIYCAPTTWQTRHRYLSPVEWDRRIEYVPPIFAYEPFMLISVLEPEMIRLYTYNSGERPVLWLRTLTPGGVGWFLTVDTLDKFAEAKPEWTRDYGRL